MSIKTTVQYKGQDYDLHSAEFKENTLSEAISSVREAQAKADAFFIKMISEGKD